MKYDFKKIQLTDIDGNVLKDAIVYKIIANLIYAKCKNLDLIDASFKINRGEEVELTDADTNEIKHLCLEDSNLMAFAKRAIRDFFECERSKK
jgi:hypothetical protein